MASLEFKPVGLLACQQQPFIEAIDTCVISCSEMPDSDGLYAVELEDTVIFPEGGGQPSDKGCIGGVEVRYVRRDGLRAIHYAAAAFQPGTRVNVKVDFERRFDHMQQHSGQHLLSALIEREYGLETVSWNLGVDISHVELNTCKDFVLSSTMLDDIEEKCNQAIIKGLPINTHVYDQDSDKVPTSVPDDYVGGVIRYVEIGMPGSALDRNACCGTHVASTAQLQQIKLAGTDRIRGGNARVFFYVGKRIRLYAQKSLNRDRTLTDLLSCPPELHCEAVERTIKQTKISIKSLKSLRRQLAPLVAHDLSRQIISSIPSANGLRSVVYYCEDGDGPFASSIGSELVKLMASSENGDAASDTEWAAIVASGAKAEGGALVIVGCNEAVVINSLARLTAVVGDCKGGFVRGVWQGKAPSFAKLAKVSL